MHTCNLACVPSAIADLRLEPVLLDVDGMKCGGCSAAVKRMLAGRPEVHSAAVNLLTGSAVVMVASPAAADLPSQLGALLSDKVTRLSHQHESDL